MSYAQAQSDLAALPGDAANGLTRQVAELVGEMRGRDEQRGK